MMVFLIDELKQQPAALRNLAHAFNIESFRQQLGEAPVFPIFTGMGASFHAAQTAALHFQSAGFPALCIEAADLANYAAPLMQQCSTLIYISQSGASGEVMRLLPEIPAHTRLIAVTNDPQSPLAQAADFLLPLYAGDELWVASKTNANALALLWMMVRHWANRWDNTELGTILQFANAVEHSFNKSVDIGTEMMSSLHDARDIFCVGHGPDAFTARQASMLISEWLKRSVRFASIAAFRHGFIETVQAGSAFIVFQSAENTKTSAQQLVQQLKLLQAEVMVIENGHLINTIQALTPGHFDSFLNPILDIVPVQIYAALEADRLGIHGFNYLDKVVTTI